uniref:Putative peptidase family m13 includes neprilysin n=1 Tax=Ixodes ricinus TaxID=34613 RepID=A0A147BEU8_IXORI
MLGSFVLAPSLFPRSRAASWNVHLDRQWHLRDIFRLGLFGGRREKSGANGRHPQHGRKYDYEKELRTSADLSVDPCDDFYGFVCGRWPESHPGQANEFTRLRSDILIAAMKRLELSSHLDPEEFSVAEHAGEALRYCLLTHIQKTEDFSPFYEILESFGFSWPQVQDGVSFDILEMAVGLALKWGLPLLFDIEVTTDLRTDNRTILRISKSEPLSLWVTEWFRKGGPRASFLQIPKVFDPSIDYPRMTNKLMEACVRAFQLLLPGGSVDTIEQPVYVKIGEVSTLSQGMLTTDRWMSTINRYFPEGINLGPDDEMHLLGKDFIWCPSSLRPRTGEWRTCWPTKSATPSTRTGWVLAHHMGAALSYRVLHEYESSFALAMFHCLNLVSEMAVYPLNWFLTEHHVTPEAWNTTGFLLEDVQKSMSESFDWMDEFTRNVALYRLRIIRHIVAYPSVVATKERLENRYGFLRYTVRPPFAHAYVLTKRIAREQRNRLLKRSMARQDDDWFSIPLVNAVFLPYYHIVLIPSSIMLPPFLVSKFPAATYGGMAHVLAHEVSHAFDADGAPADANGLYHEWYSPTTQRRIQDRKDCLRNMYSVPGNSSWFTEGEDYADSLGLKVAAKMFERHLSPEVPSGVAEFTNEQLFYVSSCFKWCSREGRANGSDFDIHSEMYRRCNAPLMEQERFFGAFKCAMGARMRPKRHCPFA